MNPWVSLPGSGNGLIRGSLHIDRTGVYGGDLIVCTTGGEVWRIDSLGNSVFIADANTHLEGLFTVPDDAAQYGPLAGCILAGAETQGLLYTFDLAGTVTTYSLGVNIEDIDLIRSGENFYGINFGTGDLLGIQSAAFDPFTGDILLTQEFGGGSSGLTVLSWDGTNLVTTPLLIGAGSAPIGQWEHVTFAPAPIAPFPQCFVAADATIEVTLGDAVTFTVMGADADPLDQVTLTSNGVPIAATFSSPLPLVGNPVSTVFSWTPTEVGTTALDFTVTDQSGLVDSCGVVINVSCGDEASFASYGAGHPGTLGVPTLSLDADLVLGTTVTLDVSNSFGQPTFTCLLLGPAQSSLSILGAGGLILVDPMHPDLMTFEYNAPTSGQQFVFFIPPVLASCGAVAYLQAIVHDPGAAGGPWAFSAGLQVIFGF